MTETTFETKTARVLLTERLTNAEGPLAVHELGIIGHSENSLATELSIMAKKGIVSGRYRLGKRFKEWTTIARVCEFYQ